MITTCLLIFAWAASLPLWASITITVLAGVRFLAKCLKWLMKLIDACTRD